MIVVDTSALMSIVQQEESAAACLDALDRAEAVSISAATVAEALIVAGRRGIGAQMANLLEALDLEVVVATDQRARQVAAAYARWGKGVHPARLNFADCFAYTLAMERGWPLLFIGDDFAKTDVPSALAT